MTPERRRSDRVIENGAVVKALVRLATGRGGAECMRPPLAWRACLRPAERRPALRAAWGCALPAPPGLTVTELVDGARLGVRDGAPARLRSRRGAVMARAQVTPGTVFMPFHVADAAANVLTHAALDPVAKIPEYKVCAASVDP